MSENKCRKYVYPAGTFSGRPCGRPAGFGDDGSLCKRHAAGQKRSKKSHEEWNKRYELRHKESERRMLERSTCAGLSDTDLKAMRELWEKREEIKAKLEAINGFALDCQNHVPGSSFGDIYDTLTAALSLIGGSDETK